MDFYRKRISKNGRLLEGRNHGGVCLENVIILSLTRFFFSLIKKIFDIFSGMVTWLLIIGHVFVFLCVRITKKNPLTKFFLRNP